MLTSKYILRIQAELEANTAGFRRLPGAALKNNAGVTVYTPPQNPDMILDLMGYLEKFINDDSLFDADPLVKMALIHHQFESIHPFYDGNGRTGRILAVLYLVQQGLLDSPVSTSAATSSARSRTITGCCRQLVRRMAGKNG